MADKKISALTSAATPLAGTEVLPIVQSGSTVKVSIDNVTKGRTVNASSFDTDVAAAAVTLSGTTLAADGTDANININITPKGSGALVTTNLTTSGNTILGDAAADTLNFAAGALVKTTDGIFGINTTPSSWAGRAFGYTPFQIGNGAITDVANVHTELSYNQYIDTGGTRRYITANPAAFHRVGNATYSWFLAPAGAADAAITFTQVMELNAAGNLTLNTGNLVVGTVGKGIDFSANAHAAGMTSELLNDYEEGTWTPELSFGGGSTGIIYSVQAGSYTKIGNRVFVTANLILTNKGSSTGIVRITTPYPVANNNNARGGLALGYVESITFTGQMFVESFQGTSEFRVGYFTEAGGNASVTDANFANNSIIMFSGSYYTA